MPPIPPIIDIIIICANLHPKSDRKSARSPTKQATKSWKRTMFIIPMPPPPASPVPPLKCFAAAVETSDPYLQIPSTR